MHPQSGSIGSGSSLNLADLMLNLPKLVNSVPFLAFLVGMTQSNISTPLLTFSTKSSGVPTPMR